MKNIISTEELKFQNDPSVNEQGQAVLGHLEGPCADFISPTRNGRLYSEELWERVFADPITQEYFESGGIFGELCHPDREEVDLEKVAICMPKPPTKDSSGKLIGRFDILDTPCGRVLKTLCEYGYRLGISSRGNGDLETDYDGNESVVPSSYKLSAFDIVTLPAVKAARLEFTENLKRPISKALTEALDTSTKEERKIMEEALQELNINYQSSEEEVNDIVAQDDPAANDDGAKLVEELQTTLDAKLNLEAEVASLKENLSVCYAKEKGLQETLSRKELTIKRLLEQAKRVEPLKSRVQTLEESFNQHSQSVAEEKQKIELLNENLSSQVALLKESLSEKESKVEQLLKESIEHQKNTDFEKRALNEQLNAVKNELADMKADSAIKNSEYKKKLSDVTRLIESYKQISTNAVDRYIESQAHLLGISAQDIKNKLNEKYSLDDVDKVCGDLREYKVNISSLPFTMTPQSKVRITESKETRIMKSPYDDDVDDSLFTLLQ